MGDNIQYIELVNLINVNISNNDELNKIKSQYIDLLMYLTQTNDMTIELFVEQIKKINNCGQIIIAVSGNLSSEFVIIGSGTVIIEPKIIHSTCSVAHIEDIVVHPNFRGKSIAKNIIKRLKDYAITNSCYKVILNCKDEYVKMYEHSGFIKKGNEMSYYFN